MKRLIDSFTLSIAIAQHRHRRARLPILAHFFLTFMLQACTTPNQAGRLIFQRGATPIPQPIVWLDFDGQIAIQPKFDQSVIRQKIHALIQAQLVPQKPNPSRALKLQSVIVGCKPKPNPSCGMRVVVEVVGNDQRTILRAMEGIAELNLARPADTETVSRALSTLLETAVHTAIHTQDQRPAAVSKMEQLIRQGSTEQIQHWTRQLEDESTSEVQRINLWIALGHVATRAHLEQLKTIQTRSDREAQVRHRALRWIDAASSGAGKSSPAHVKSSLGKDGDRP